MSACRRLVDKHRLDRQTLDLSKVLSGATPALAAGDAGGKGGGKTGGGKGGKDRKDMPCFSMRDK
eukprot:2507222-Heterocapsa_arctica.AAC.1